jgi:hypothetical protein
MFEERRGRERRRALEQGSQERERIWGRSRSSRDVCVMSCFVRQGQLIARDAGVDGFLDPKKERRKVLSAMSAAEPVIFPNVNNLTLLTELKEIR